MDASFETVGEPKRKATYDDVLSAPEHKVAEILDGELFLSPRPAARHAHATSILGSELVGPFDREPGDPHGGSDVVRVEPFAAVELEMARLWID